MKKELVVKLNGTNIKLKESLCSKLQIGIMEQLLPMISEERLELLYIAADQNKELWKKDMRMTELGIDIQTIAEDIPDLIAYDDKRDKIIFISAINSSGIFTPDRVQIIRSLCCCRSEAESIFVTAFDTTADMLQNYESIAVNTNIWTADEPTHVTNKIDLYELHGNKYIGWQPL